MKPQIPSYTGLSTRFSTPGTLVSVVTLALVLALGACSKQDDNQTAGQQVDAAIAKTEQAAQQARADMERSAQQAKAATESGMASAATALQDATHKAESSIKDAAGKMGDKMDDMSITASVSNEIAKDGDLSMMKINVDTKDGAVTLNGSAPNEAAREKAALIAKTVKGVQTVDNKLVVNAN